MQIIHCSSNVYSQVCMVSFIFCPKMTDPCRRSMTHIPLGKSVSYLSVPLRFGLTNRLVNGSEYV